MDEGARQAHLSCVEKKYIGEKKGVANNCHSRGVVFSPCCCQWLFYFFHLRSVSLSPYFF